MCLLFGVLLLNVLLLEGRIISHRQPRLSLAESAPSYYYTDINGVPGTYSFGYDVSDADSGNTQFRNEERYPNGTVIGSYGYIDPSGKPVRYKYIADERGYRVSRIKPTILNLPIPPPPVNTFSDYNKEDSVTWSRKKLQNSHKKPSYNNVQKFYKNRNINKFYNTNIPMYDSL